MAKNPDILDRILLDTHIWLWLMSGAEKALSPRLRALIEERSSKTAVWISAISLWEVGMLAAKKRIVFTCDAKEWIYRALRAPGILTEPVGAEIAIESAALHGNFHGDPADRMIVASAKHLNATLITHDKEILAYCQHHNLSALSL